MDSLTAVTTWPSPWCRPWVNRSPSVIKLQVDLPGEVALTEDLDFHRISLSLDPEPTSCGITQQMLERGGHALIYLLTLHFYEPLELNRQSATITL